MGFNVTPLFALALLGSGCVETVSMRSELFALDREQQQAKADFARKLQEDDRVPTQEDISGLWTSGPNLVGYTVQFDVSETAVVGRGYHWGCLGLYDDFELAGTYDGNVLTFVTDEHPERTRRFKCRVVGGFPRLREIVGNGEYAEEPRTTQELEYSR